MKLVALALIVAVCFASYSEPEYLAAFKTWVQKHEMVFSHTEFYYRYAVFKANLDRIEAHNARNGATYKMAMNAFGHLTPAEFVAQYAHLSVGPTHGVSASPRVTVPDQIDWQKKGCVAAVKDQGQCGSCWAFSAVGEIESAVCAHFFPNSTTPTVVPLSEQQLVDCSKKYGNEGCNGGLMDYAFQYVKDHGGLCSEHDYPYKAVDGKCKDTKCKSQPHTNIAGWVDVPKADEDALKTATALQPVAVAVNAEPWQFYTSGIFSDDCDPSTLDHGVLLTGYALSGSTKYWRIKNSWGADWGESGYIRLLRNDGSGTPGTCGVTEMASYVTF